MKRKFMILLLISTYLVACSGEKKEPIVNNPAVDIGVGVITKVDLSENVDATMASEGEKAFVTKCSACHKLDEKYVGPPLRNVTKRRSPEWIMNMILDPEKMTKENPTAKALYEEYMTQMTNQNVEKVDARKILEYLRSIAN